MMASLAGYRDDIAGAIVTGGTSTAYTVTSYQVFNSLANMSGQLVAFTPHATNGATVTLNVDGLGAKPLRPAPSVELQSNVLILGTPYVALYNNSDAVWYLHNLGSNTYGVPLGAGMDFWLPTAPSSAFAFPYGQAISRTTYATLFAAMGTTFGAGDGSTTFNLPDKRGRVAAASDSMGGVVAGRITTTSNGFTTTGVAGTGGGATQVLVQANLPNVNFVVASGQTVDVTASRPAGTHGAGTTGYSINGNSLEVVASTGTVTSTGTAASGGSGTAFGVVQPTIICNYILRVI